jgi:GAF domain-containing protein
MADPRSRDERVQEYLERIVAGGDFPAFTERLHEVIDVLQQEETGMQSLANVVLGDYSLTLKVLRTVNSFHYNRSGRHVLSVTQAMVVLGVETVRDLAGSLVLLEHYARKAPALKQLMALSMLTASHARLAAEHVRLPRPEQAHLAAMFRNVGEVLLACHFPDDYAAVLSHLKKHDTTLGAASLAVLHFRFEDLGEAACRHWGLAGFGGAPAPGGPTTDLERLVSFGHDLTNAVYRQVPTESPQTLTLILQRYGHALGLTVDTLQGILREGCAETNEMFASLGLSTADLRLSRQVDAAMASLAPDDEPGVSPSDTPPDTLEIVIARGPDSPAARQQLIGELEAAVTSPGHFEVNEILLTVLEAIVRAGPFSRAAFCLLTDTRTELVGRFGLGEGVDAFVKRLRFPVTLGPQGLAVGSAVLRRLDLFAALARNPAADEARLLALLGAQTVLVLPLVIENRSVGAIIVDRTTTTEPPDAATVTFAVHLRDLAVRAMRRARAEREDAAKVTAQLGPEARRDLVLRLLKGEPVEAVSQESRVPVKDLRPGDWPSSTPPRAPSRRIRRQRARQPAPDGPAELGRGGATIGERLVLGRPDDGPRDARVRARSLSLLERLLHAAILARVEREHHHAPAGGEARRQRCQQRVERGQFVVHQDANRLEGAPDRHLHLGLRQGGSRGGQGLAHLPIQRMRGVGTGGGQALGDHRGVGFVGKPGEHVGDGCRVELGQSGRRRRARGGIQAQVQRPGELVAEPARGRVVLHCGHAEVHQDGVDPRAPEGGQDGRQIPEARVAQRQDLGAVAGVSQARLREGQFEGVDVEAEQVARRTEVPEDGGGVSAATDRAVDDERAGRWPKMVEDLLHHDRAMRTYFWRTIDHSTLLSMALALPLIVSPFTVPVIS